MGRIELYPSHTDEITLRDSTSDDLLELIRQKLHCTYISDLRNEPNNSFARLLLKKPNLNKYSLKVLNDTCIYLYCGQGGFTSQKGAIAFTQNKSTYCS